MCRQSSDGAMLASGTPRKRFTLTELLVVIAVIMVLAALLMPTLSSAVSLARQAACANNMRNLHMACTMYATDHADWMPPTTWNAQHMTYLNHYLRQTFDAVPQGRTATYNGCYSLGPANRKPRGNSAYCPALYANASASPSWSGASEGVYYYPNYMVTLRSTFISTATNKSGCWMMRPPVSGQLPTRKMSTIMNRSAIMGEANYCTSSPYNAIGQANQAGTLYNTKANADMFNASAPAWNLHSFSANFLFRDGYVKKLFMKTNFDTTEYALTQ